MSHEQRDRETETVELTTVFASRGPAMLGLAKAVLESAGIPFVVNGELMSGERDGDLQIQVRREQAEEARTLLADIR
jgi:hypothetical protein